MELNIVNEKINIINRKINVINGKINGAIYIDNKIIQCIKVNICQIIYLLI